VISFVWAMSGHFFRTVGKLPTGVRLIQVTGAMAFAANIIVLSISGCAQVASGLFALVLYTASLGLFWWSIAVHRGLPPTHAFTKDTPEHLVQDGPYRVIRHPCYTAYLLAWVAGPIATQEPLLFIPVLLFGGIYWQAARLEERKFAMSPLAGQYAAYRARTGMFIPTKICSCWQQHPPSSPCSRQSMH
jgi:protein-S-isoprenylcysteine O-methyltransferase Ste14